MASENESLQYLKEILANYGEPNLIQEEGYEMLASEHLVSTHNQAKVIARLVKDVAQVNYSAGYADGRADQAAKDAYDLGVKDGQSK